MNFLGVGVGELLLILVIATIVVGPERMVQLSGQLGRALAKFREQTDSVTREFKEAFELEIQEVNEAGQSLKEAAAEITGKSLPSGAGSAQAGGAEAKKDATSAESVASVAETDVDGAAEAMTEVEPEPSAEEVAAFEAEQLEQRLALGMFDGEVEVSLAEATPGTNGDGAEADAETYEDIAPIDVPLAAIVPEDEDVEPTAVNDVLVISDDEPSAELPVEAEE